MILDQPSGPERPQKESPLFKVLIANFAIALLLWGFAGTDLSRRLFHISTFDIIINLILLNFFAGLILRFIPKTRALGFAMLISSLVLVVVGFGICTANLNL